MFGFPGSLALTIPSLITNHLEWVIAIAVVVVGILVFGQEDLGRFRFRRAWAISDVCFAESLRRKILWVTPMAILGVIAVTTLQHTSDPQESIRQTIKFC